MSEHERKVADEEVQREITDFCTEVAEREVDAEVGKAEIWDMFPDRSSSEEGLVLILETATGKRVTKWLRKPDPNEGLMAAFNQIFAYCDVDKTNPENLLGQSVPIEYDRHTDEWEINWREIERTLAERSDRALEEGKADAE